MGASSGGIPALRRLDVVARIASAIVGNGTAELCRGGGLDFASLLDLL